MGNVAGLPDAALAAIVAAGLAALGYVAKLALQGLMAWRTARAERLARLLDLSALLRASGVAFQVQRQLADRLAEMLRSRHAGDLPSLPGLERLFTSLHDRFDAEEAELHSIIRGYTEHAMRPLNESMLEWLQSDRVYRTGRWKGPAGTDLPAFLVALEAHLMLWLAKYRSWIVNQPAHALVYLADESEHGLGFPRGIEEAVERALTRMSRRWPLRGHPGAGTASLP